MMKKIDERAELQKVQKALKTIKIALGKIEKLNREEGRLPAANAAYRWQQEAGVYHAKATEDLFKHWPQEFAGEIVAFGGGDR